MFNKPYLMSVMEIKYCLFVKREKLRQSNELGYYVLCEWSCTIKESCQRYNMDLIKKLKFVSMAEFRQNNSGTCDYYIPEKDKKNE